MTIIIKMTEARYNNRQIENMLDRQSADLKEHMSLIIDPLVRQVEKTNGRVSRNEVWINRAVGAVSIISMIIFPFIGYVIYDYFAFKERFPGEVRDAVYQALDNYQFDVIDPMIK